MRQEITDIYVWPDGAEQWFGPYTIADVQGMVSNSEIAKTDYASFEGSSERATVADIPGIRRFYFQRLNAVVTDIYIWPDGAEQWFGPYTVADVQRMLDNLEIAKTDYASFEGSLEATTVVDIPGIRICSPPITKRSNVRPNHMGQHQVKIPEIQDNDEKIKRGPWKITKSILKWCFIIQFPLGAWMSVVYMIYETEQPVPLKELFYALLLVVGFWLLYRLYDKFVPASSSSTSHYHRLAALQRGKIIEQQNDSSGGDFGGF